MEIVAAIVLGGGVAVYGFLKLNPPCPSCRARKWDRRLCRPLLLCRRCAQRVDRYGQRYN